MWLWLRKKLPKSFQLWSKLTGYVGALHLVVLFGLFFVYKGDNHSLSFTLNRHIDLSAAVVFLPLQKRAGIANVAGNNQKPAQAAEQPVIKKAEEKAPKTAKAKKESSYAKATEDKKATTCMATAPSKKKAKSKPKKLVAQKKEEPKKEIEPEPEAKKVEELLPLATTADVANAQVGTENIQYLGQLDLEALQMHNAINDEVGQHWSPPPGISKNAMCELNVIVGWDGAINFSIKESSGIPMYDVSVRSAMLKVAFPKQLWGKEFSIVFKQ